MKKFWIFLFAVIFVGLALPGFVNAMTGEAKTISTNNIDRSEKADLAELSEDSCVERLKAGYPDVSEERVMAACKALKQVAKPVDVQKSFASLSEEQKQKVSDLSTELQNKLKLMNREQLKEISMMTAEQIRERLQNQEVVKVYDKEKGFKKRVVSENQKQELKKKYSGLIDSSKSMEKLMVQEKDMFQKYKNMEKSCDENNSTNSSEETDCEQARQRAREKAQEYLSKVGELELNALNRIQTRTRENEDLTEEEVQEILDDIDAEKMKINSALEELKNAETKEEIKAAGEKITNLWQNMKQRFVVHQYRLVKSNVGGILLRAKVLDRQLERLLEYYNSNNLDYSQIEPIVDEYSVLVESAREKFSQADEKFKEAWELNKQANPDVEKIKELSEEGRDLVKEAQEDLKSAADKLKEIFGLVKDNKKMLEEVEEDDYYDLEPPKMPEVEDGDNGSDNTSQEGTVGDDDSNGADDDNGQGDGSGNSQNTGSN